jgi:hypothetical protein
MNTTMKIAFICYLLVALSYVLFGLVYLFSSEIMPYHQEVIGMDWEKVDPRFQKMFLSFLHVMGLLLLSVGYTIIILILMPFRKGEAWTRWLIPLIILPSSIYLQYMTLHLKSTMQASTPWHVNAIGLLLIIAAIILSYIPYKQENQSS